MKTSKVTFRLSPNEEALVLQKERDRRRRLRIQQVREQERAFAKLVRKQVEVKRKQELCILAGQLEQEWLETKLEKQETLDEVYRRTLETVGKAHTSAQEQPPLQEIRERAKVENARKAKERGRKAIEKQQEDDEDKIQEEFAHIMARKTALEIERARAALIAKKPHRNSDISQPDPVKQPTRVLHHEGFSTTHYTIPTEYAERADPEEQGDAKKAAVDEEERLQEETRERQQELKERQTKAALRQKHAQEKERMERAKSDLLEELDQMEQADRRRRQLIVSNIPKQIFQPPHKRLEEKEDYQKDLEEAFENMYMAKTDYVGDLELALEPALPQVEADLDLSSDSPGEEFQIPGRKIPRKFPQGLDGDHSKKPVPVKKDTLKKLLLKIHSQKQDHKIRKKAELVGESVDSQPYSITSITPSYVTSSDVTPSSVTGGSNKSEVSSSQPSSQLSQHPLSSGNGAASSQTTTDGSDAMETGTISEGSVVTGGGTLMHPLEEARRVRGVEGDTYGHNRFKRLDIRQTEGHPETFRRLSSEASTPVTPVPVFDYGEIADRDDKGSEQQRYDHTSGNASGQQQEDQALRDAGDQYAPHSRDVGKIKDSRTRRGNLGNGLETLPPLDGYHPVPPYMHPIGGNVREENGGRGPFPGDDDGSGHYLRTQLEGGLANQHELSMTHAAVLSQHYSIPLANGIPLGISNHTQKSHHLAREHFEPMSDGNYGHDEVQYTDIERNPETEFDKYRSQATVGQPIEGIYPYLDTNQTTFPGRGRDVSKRTEKGSDRCSGGSPQKVRQEPADIACENGTRSLETMPQGHLESVRQKYPNIYETLTGRKPHAKEIADSSSEKDSLPAQPYHKVKGYGSQVSFDKRRRQVLGRNVREVSPEQHFPSGNLTKGFQHQRQGDDMRIPSDYVTSHDQEMTLQQPLPFEQTSNGREHGSEFQSLLHDYQQQLLKLQRTNEAEILQAQSHLRERRQRLLELYPLSQVHSESSDVTSGKQTNMRDIVGGRAGRQGDNLRNENESRISSRRLRDGEQGYISSSGSTGSQSRNSDSKLEHSTNDTSNDEGIKASPSSVIDLSIPGMMKHQPIGHPSYNTAYKHNASITPSSNLHPGGPQHVMNSHNQRTPPFYYDQTESRPQSKTTNFLPLSPKVSVSTEESSPSSPRQQNLERLPSSAFRVISTQGIVHEAPQQRYSIEDQLGHPSGKSDGHRWVAPYSTQPREDSSNKDGLTSTQVTWRPVRELHVSLPTASNELDEQSPLHLTSSPLTDDNTFTSKSPSSPAKMKTLDGIVLEQGLLTPRKLTQTERNYFFPPNQDPLTEREVVTTSQSLAPVEPVSPGMLITPRMLLGNRIDDSESDFTKMSESHLPSATGNVDAMMVHSISQRPHYDIPDQVSDDEDNPVMLQREENGMSTNSNVTLEQSKLSESTTSDFTQRQVRSAFQVTQSPIDQNDPIPIPPSNQVEGFQNVGASRFGRKSANFSHNWHETQVLSGNDEMQSLHNVRYRPVPEKDAVVGGTLDSNETNGAGILRVKYKPNHTDQRDDSVLEASNRLLNDGEESLEEPTDKGLLEALKNLMLAKARSQVPGAVTVTSNYFGHLDLTNSGLSERGAVEMKGDNNEESTESAPEVRKEEEIDEEDNQDIAEVEMEAEEEAKMMIDRQRLHHRPPVASFSKLMAFDEVAPHELSTIIEVESPQFEALPGLSFTGGKDTSRFGKEGAPAVPLSSDGTSSSSWGTPQHHKSALSMSSGSDNPGAIYIHQPTEAFSLDEEPFEDGGNSHLSTASRITDSQTDERSLLQSNHPLSEITTDTYTNPIPQQGIRVQTSMQQGNLVPKESLPEVGHEERVYEDVTISEGPINSSSDISINESQITEGEDEPVEDLSQHSKMFPLSLTAINMRNTALGAAESKPYFTDPYQQGSSQMESRDGMVVDSLVSRELKQSGITTESLESSSFMSQEAIATDGGISLLRGTDNDPELPLEVGYNRSVTSYDSGHVPSFQESQRMEESLTPRNLSSGIHQEGKDERMQELSDAKFAQVFMSDRSNVSQAAIARMEEGPLEDTLEETRGTENTEEDYTFHSLVPQETISESLDTTPSKVNRSSHDVDKGVKSVQNLGIDRRSFHPAVSPARFFTEVRGHQSGGSLDSMREEQSHQHGSERSEMSSQLMTVETGIMEEPELTFQTTFDTNMTLESVVGEHAEGSSNFASHSESLLSFMKHEEQFAHSTPMKSDSQTRHAQDGVVVGPENTDRLNQNSNAQSGPLTLQEALAKHKAGFIKASQTRQAEVKVQKGGTSQPGTAFAMTIKNWQKARLQAQQKKQRPKVVKKSQSGNKENVEKIRTAPRAKTMLDRKAAQKADKERTKRLYNQLDEVKQRQTEAERQKKYAENRKKRKEYEEKLKKRRILIKSQAQSKT
ncbi:uncharacterized protein [Apostichopus japonicus]